METTTTHRRPGFMRRVLVGATALALPLTGGSLLMAAAPAHAQFFFPTTTTGTSGVSLDVNQLVDDFLCARGQFFDGFGCQFFDNGFDNGGDFQGGDVTQFDNSPIFLNQGSITD